MNADEIWTYRTQLTDEQLKTMLLGREKQLQEFIPPDYKKPIRKEITIIKKIMAERGIRA